MSIDRLKKEGRVRWTTVSTDSMELIPSAEALAIWVFLMSRPDDWTVVPGWTRKRLGLGEVRWKNAIKLLESLGLYEVKSIRDPANGRFVGREIIIREEPAEHSGFSGFGVPPCSDLPETGRNRVQQTDDLYNSRVNTTTDLSLSALDLVLSGQSKSVLANIKRAYAQADSTQKQRFVAAVLVGHKSAKSLAAWVQAMSKKAAHGELGLAVGEKKVMEEMRSKEIEAMAARVMAAAEGGNFILLDDRKVELDGGYLRVGKSSYPLKAAIAEGRVKISETETIGDIDG